MLQDRKAQPRHQSRDREQEQTDDDAHDVAVNGNRASTVYSDDDDDDDEQTGDDCKQIAYTGQNHRHNIKLVGSNCT